MASEQIIWLPSNEFVEIPTELGKRHEPAIKGKGVPVSAIVSYAVHHSMTPEQISNLWEGYITPQEVEAAIEYAQEYPELVDDKLSDEGDCLGH
jgi:uncharacterized protein (DUF433 family)